MILDGFWKAELKQYAQRLKFWGKQRGGIGTYAEHQVNKYLLYSAIVIRKLMEDEIDAKKQYKQSTFSTPELPLFHYDLPVVEYAFNGDKDFILHNVITDYYNAGNRSVTVEAKTICNSIVHSYIWNLACNNKRIVGFLTASDYDKEKKLYFVKLRDWIDCINCFKEKCSVK